MSDKRPVEDSVIGMVMSETEILRDYRLALNKRKQVEILAQLNCCTKRQMARFLADHGEEVDGRLLNSGGSRKAADTHTQPAAGDGAAESAEDPSHAEEPGEAVPAADAGRAAGSPDAPSREQSSGQQPRDGAPGSAAAAGEKDDLRGMTAGVLAALLAKIDPEAVVRMDGEGVVSWLHVSVCYGPDGERRESEVVIHPDE